MSAPLLNHRYQIISTLARGGFGETYIAIDTQMPSKRHCVIKKLHPAVQSEEMPAWLLERFEREAAVLEELGEKNPQIPRLYGYFDDGNDFYLVQEWIEGVTLTQKHAREGNLSELAVTEILVRLLPVLDFIHRRRIIHRDVKPDNIILRKSDNLPVLIDFGVMKEAVATLVDPTGKSAYSIALGTPGYMASEQAAGRPVYSSDLYSLGLTAIYLLTGKTPQYLETDSRTGELLWRHEADNPHSSLAMVLDKAIRFHPRDRYATASEMLAALQEMPASMTAAPTVAVSPDRIPPLTPKRNPARTAPEPVRSTGKNPFPFLLLLAGVTVGAFALGYLGFMALLPRGDRPRSTPTPTPSPSPSPEPSPIEIAPPVTRPIPERSPVYRPRRTYRPRPTPTPSVTPEPSPEVTITPTPEVTPTPEAIPIPVPPPETDPSPLPSPSPETEPAPVPVPTPTPAPPESPIEPSPPPAIEPEPRESPPPEG